LPEGKVLFVPFELGLLFSFQRPTLQNPEQCGFADYFWLPGRPGSAEFIQFHSAVNSFFLVSFGPVSKERQVLEIRRSQMRPRLQAPLLVGAPGRLAPGTLSAATPPKERRTMGILPSARKTKNEKVKRRGEKGFGLGSLSGRRPISPAFWHTFWHMKGPRASLPRPCRAVPSARPKSLKLHSSAANAAPRCWTPPRRIAG
jgi:hypothetical protein